MPISFKCACGQSLKVRDEAAGKRVKCPKCGQPSTVPAPAPPEDPEIRIIEEGPASPAPSAMPGGHRAAEPAVPGRTRPRLRPQESEMPYVLRGVAGGVAAAVLGAFVWYLIAKGIHAKISWVAWGIGWATGFGVVVLSGGKGGSLLCLAGAGTALLGWLLGEYFIYSWAIPDFLEKELREAAGRGVSAEKIHEAVAEIMSQISFGDYLSKSFKGITLLFVLLAVATGWGVPKKMGAAD